MSTTELQSAPERWVPARNQLTELHRAGEWLIALPITSPRGAFVAERCPWEAPEHAQAAKLQGWINDESGRVGSATEGDLLASLPGWKPCESCNATGSQVHDCGCEHCDYTGSEACDGCRGTARVYLHDPEPVEFQDRGWDAALLDSVLRAFPPDATVGVYVQPHGRPGELIVHFSAGDTHGFVVQLRNDYYRGATWEPNLT